MQEAIIAIEDSRFYQHGGVDPKGLFRAAVANYANKGVVQGASTLTQQYVKNVLVETANVRGDRAGVEAATDKTSQRKVREIKFAISLEKKYPKDEILKRYLNIAYFGDEVYGVEAASRYYFNKAAKDLTLPEAALLAGLVQSPGAWSPKRPEKAKERRDVVLRRMRDLKMISPAEYTQARETPIQVTMDKPRRGCANAGSNAWYCDYVWRLIIKSDEFASIGRTADERRPGAAARRSHDHHRDEPDDPGRRVGGDQRHDPEGRPEQRVDGRGHGRAGHRPVLAIAQNKLFDPRGGPGLVATNFATDYAYGGSGGFQTGSTFKPFTLATWLKKGKSLNAVVSAKGGTAPFTSFRSCDYLDRSQSYTYSNSEGDGSGSMTVLEATYRSVNTAYVSMEKQLDLCDIAETAESMGVHLASPQEDQCKRGEQRTIKLPDLHAGAHARPQGALADDDGRGVRDVRHGRHVLQAGRRPVDQGPQRQAAAPSRSRSCKRALDKDVAAGVNFALQKVLTQGTAAGLGIGRPAGGKTGTTNNSVDTWFVGYTAQRSTAVWVGDPVPRGEDRVRKTLNGRTIAGDRQGNVFGEDVRRADLAEDHDARPTQGCPSAASRRRPASCCAPTRATCPTCAGSRWRAPSSGSRTPGSGRAWPGSSRPSSRRGRSPRPRPAPGRTSTRAR